MAKLIKWYTLNLCGLFDIRPTSTKLFKEIKTMALWPWESTFLNIIFFMSKIGVIEGTYLIRLVWGLKGYSEQSVLTTQPSVNSRIRFLGLESPLYNLLSIWPQTSYQTLCLGITVPNSQVYYQDWWQIFL